MFSPRRAITQRDIGLNNNKPLDITPNNQKQEFPARNTLVDSPQKRKRYFSMNSAKTYYPAVPFSGISESFPHLEDGNIKEVV